MTRCRVCLQVMSVIGSELERKTMTQKWPATLSDNELFNEYWRVVDDINDHENAEIYDWDINAWEYNEKVIAYLCDQMTELENEASIRRLSLKWPDVF